jgi:hypothetical protein
VSVGPLGDLGVLCVMHAPSHAKSAKVARKDRFPVASELVSDVSRRRADTNVARKVRRYSGKVQSSRVARRSLIPALTLRDI